MTPIDMEAKDATMPTRIFIDKQSFYMNDFLEKIIQCEKDIKYLSDKTSQCGKDIKDLNKDLSDKTTQFENDKEFILNTLFSIYLYIIYYLIFST